MRWSVQNTYCSGLGWQLTDDLGVSCGRGQHVPYLQSRSHRHWWIFNRIPHWTAKSNYRTISCLLQKTDKQITYSGKVRKADVSRAKAKWWSFEGCCNSIFNLPDLRAVFLSIYYILSSFKQPSRHTACPMAGFSSRGKLGLLATVNQPIWCSSVFNAAAKTTMSRLYVSTMVSSHTL